MMSLLTLFREQGWHVTFACTAADSSHSFPLQSLGIESVSIAINDSTFDAYLYQIKPDLVLYDRFMIEEQFSWRVDKNCPEAMTLLETSDLHCLRYARQEALKQGRGFQQSDLVNEKAYREVASILRTDLSLMISSVEMTLLKDVFNVSESIVHHFPFVLEQTESATKAWPSFEERIGFISIGNFKHAPNWDSVQYLKQQIWPRIHQQLPKAELHIYGAYPPPKAMQLHKPSEGFYIKGWADDAQAVIQQARICLAPLRFGAGLKGKLLDAMAAGTPSITTSVGAEAMHDGLPWNGCIADDPDEIANAAVALYQNKPQWLQCQQNGLDIIQQCYNPVQHETGLLARIQGIQQDLVAHRKYNFLGNMLKHHLSKSTQYMSLWIEEKNKQPTIGKVKD